MHLLIFLLTSRMRFPSSLLIVLLSCMRAKISSSLSSTIFAHETCVVAAASVFSFASAVLSAAAAAISVAAAFVFVLDASVAAAASVTSFPSAMPSAAAAIFRRCRFCCVCRGCHFLHHCFCIFDILLEIFVFSFKSILVHLSGLFTIFRVVILFLGSHHWVGLFSVFTGITDFAMTRYGRKR